MSLQEILRKRLHIGENVQNEMSFNDVKNRFASKDSGKSIEVVVEKLEEDFDVTK